MALNPAAGILDSFSSGVGGRDGAELDVSRGEPPGDLVIGLLGYLLFKRLEPNFADVI